MGRTLSADSAAESAPGYAESDEMQALDRMEDVEPEEQPKAADKKDDDKDKPPASDEVTARLAALERENEELRRTNKDWMEVAKGKKTAPAKGEKEEGEKPVSLRERLKIRKSDPSDTPDALLTDFETRGSAALTDRGIVTEERLVEILEEFAAANGSAGVTRKEMEEAIQAQVESFQVDRQLSKKHPELDDEESPLYKAAQKEIQAAVEAGDNSVLTQQGLDRVMRMLKAEAALKADKKAATNGAARQTDDEDSGRRRRQARAEAQDVAGSGSGGDSEDDDEPLSAQQLQIAKRLKVSPEAYRKRAKQGIKMGGIPGR